MKKYLSLFIVFTVLLSFSFAPNIQMKVYAQSGNSVNEVVKVSDDAILNDPVTAPQLIIGDDKGDFGSKPQIFTLELENAEWLTDDDFYGSSLQKEMESICEIITITRLTDTTVQAQVYNKNTADTMVKIPMLVQVENEGEVKVSIDPMNSDVSGGTYKIALASSRRTVTTIEDVRTFNDTVELDNIKIEEAYSEALPTTLDKKIKYELPKGFEWTCGGNVKTYGGLEGATGVISTNKSVLEINMDYSKAVSRYDEGRIILEGASIKATSEANSGNVIMKISGNGIENEEILIGIYDDEDSIGPTEFGNISDIQVTQSEKDFYKTVVSWEYDGNIDQIKGFSYSINPTEQDKLCIIGRNKEKQMKDSRPYVDIDGENLILFLAITEKESINCDINIIAHGKDGQKKNYKTMATLRIPRTEMALNTDCINISELEDLKVLSLKNFDGDEMIGSDYEYIARWALLDKDNDWHGSIDEGVLFVSHELYEKADAVGRVTSDGRLHLEKDKGLNTQEYVLVVGQMEFDWDPPIPTVISSCASKKINVISNNPNDNLDISRIYFDGPPKLGILDNKDNVEKIQYRVLDSKGQLVEGVHIKAKLIGKYEGVNISEDGIITVSPNAQEGEVRIYVYCEEKPSVAIEEKMLLVKQNDVEEVSNVIISPGDFFEMMIDWQYPEDKGKYVKEFEIKTYVKDHEDSCIKYTAPYSDSAISYIYESPYLYGFEEGSTLSIVFEITTVGIDGRKSKPVKKEYQFATLDPLNIEIDKIRIMEDNNIEIVVKTVTDEKGYDYLVTKEIDFPQLTKLYTGKVLDAKTYYTDYHKSLENGNFTNDNKLQLIFKNTDKNVKPEEYKLIVFGRGRGIGVVDVKVKPESNTSSHRRSSHNEKDHNKEDDEIIEKALKEAKNIDISLANRKEEKTHISLYAINKVMKAEKTLKIKNKGISLVLSKQSLPVTKLKESSEDIYLEISAKAVNDTTKNEIVSKAVENTGLFQVGSDVFELSCATVSDDRTNKISHFDDPVSVTIDLSDENLSEEEIKSLTGIRYKKNEKGNIIPVKLGGTYDQDTETFTFYTDQFSLYGVLKANDLRKINLTIDDDRASINNISNTLDTSPIIKSNRTMVPLRFVAEALGAKVKWIRETNTVELEIDDKKLSLVIGQKGADMDVPAIIENGRTLVPVRYASEKLGANVLWFPSSKTIQIIK